MALFFDTDWFDARLAGLSLTRADAASALGLTQTQLDEMWKDQRELSVKDVRLLAALLATDVKEISERAGIAAPEPRGTGDFHAVTRRLDALTERFDRLERHVEEIKKLLLRK